MRRSYGWNDIFVMPDEVRAFAWSAPMRELAAKVGLSDVGLKKLLATHGVVSPPQGHWNKVLAGKPVLSPPKAPPRRPGETGRVRIDPRFAEVLTVVPPMPSTGPFASRLVPEDLEELRTLETKQIGRVSVPKSLEGAHRGLREILSKEARRREKVAQSHWHWDEPKFDNPVAKRRLRILNGIFVALEKRGHTGHAYERDGELHAGATVGDTHVGIEVAVHGKHRTVVVAGYKRPAPDLPASTSLMVRLTSGFDGNAAEAWCDDDDGKVETKLVSIVAGIIVAGEARFRRELREAEEQKEQQRLNELKRRQEKLEALNRQRVASLYESGELLRKAQNIRSLIEEVRAEMAAHTDVTKAELSEWESWAFAEADKIDPIRSGQFRSHFRAPTLDDIEVGS